MRQHVIVFLILVGWLGCSESFDPIPFSNELDLPSKYSYELMINCFCITTYVGPHKICIEDDAIIDYELLIDTEPDDNIDLTQFTISSLVDRVNEILSQDPVIKNIENHPDYDFPMKVYFDIDERLADEEWGYEISNFKVERD